MDKLKEMDGKTLGICLSAVILVLGLVGVLAGSPVLGVIMVVLQVAVAFFLIMQTKSESKGNSKGDKYRKLFMNLPIGFAQAKIETDPTGQVIGYRMVDANETFGFYFNLDRMDYLDRVIGESHIEVLQDINAWFRAYNNSGTKEGDLMDVEITMEKLGKVFNTVMYKSEADYINMVVIDVTEQKETEAKLSRAIEDANAAYRTQA